jgi:hypothetical protein
MNKETFEIDSHLGTFDKDNCFEIDDVVVPTIQILNRKGYITVDCCAGHPFNTAGNGMYSSYISFKEGIVLPSLPPGYTLNNNIIRRFWDFELDFYAFIRDNIETMAQLYKWALDLPACEEVVYNPPKREYPPHWEN